ncbi:MAG: hypothetical protein FWG98_09360 [Candidatus Cloacimonetes bacterium]|nr:hypothetical protein [Candidatus Cloacimonadota bacterium]
MMFGAKHKKSIMFYYLIKLMILTGYMLIFSMHLFSEEIVSIYDIQFTTNPGFDGTYPSLYVNQTVTIQGVVTAIGFENSRIFISESTGGAWSAIAIDNVRTRVSVGDFLQLRGKVSELMGMTVITQPQNLRIISRNMPLPVPVLVTAHEALTMEAYESVLVRLSNVTCRRILNGNFLALIDDETASINVGNGFNNSVNRDIFTTGANYGYIIGIVNFSHNRFAIHPRNIEDIGNDVVRGIQSSSWGRIKSLYR